MKKSVDKIFTNGTIYTLEAEGVIKEALCVKNGRIVFVGSTADALAEYESSEIIDLQGKVMLPGMGDSHLHFFAYCQSFTTVNVGDAKTKAQAMDMIRQRAQETPEGEWIKATNFDQSKWSDCEDVLPTKEDLDAVSTKHPIVLKRVCLHTAIANSMALEVAHIGKDFDFGPGGVVELREDGTPNGILREQATKIFDEIMPDPAKVPETKRKIMLKALDEAARDGITALHTYAAEIWRYTEDIEDYEQLDREGKLPLRVTIYLDKLFNKPFVTKKEMEDPFRTVQYGGLKIFCDGSLGSRSAKLFEPYDDDPGNTGILVQTQEELNEKVLKGYEQVQQVAIHCIGDKGLDCVLTAIEYALAETKKKGMTEREQWNKLPFRVIHAQMANPELIERMTKLPIILDLQPTFLMTDLHWIEDRIGEKRARNSYQWKTYQDRGLKILGGSDCPVENFSPWIGIYAAVARQDMNQYPPQGYHPEEKLSVYDAVCMYSKNVHYATGQEDYLGTLEVGKFADMVVIDRNVFEIPEPEILQVQVENTYLAGREVYSRAAQA